MIALLEEGGLPTSTRTLAVGVVALGVLGLLAGGSPVAWVLWRDEPSASAVLTSLVAHASPEHLILNVLALTALGSLVERRVGSLSVLAIMLWAALGSAAGWLVLDSGAGLGGASGVCYGLLGAGMVLCRGQRVSVAASWPLALALAWASLGGSEEVGQVTGLAALLCFLLPRRAGILLLRARLRVHWLSLPLAAQAASSEGWVAGAHWGGFLAGAAVGGVYLLYGRAATPSSGPLLRGLQAAVQGVDPTPHIPSTPQGGCSPSVSCSRKKTA